MTAGANVFDPGRFDPKDPDPWLALYLDQSLPNRRRRQAGAADRQSLDLAPMAVSDRTAAHFCILHPREDLARSCAAPA